ncbi:MAG: hypothetical protein Q4G52_02010 [Clostridia bacterium]|nr:hypothetical protein [Clostridia bacterium]
MKRKQRTTTLLCILGGTGAMLLSLALCLVFFDVRPRQETPAAPESTALPYSASSPFTVSDLTSAQLSQLRSQGRMSVSDGPRGISIGDSLETLLERYPSTFTELQPETDLTGEQSLEEIILYCASYFENQNGVMTALPPRGLLTVDGGMIVVTLLAPTAAYPAGTLDNYGSYEHVYCIYTVEPENMTVSSIVLGINR